MKPNQERLGNGTLINDGDDQIVVFPPGLRFRGTLVSIGRSDTGIYIEPLTSKPRASKNQRPRKKSKDQSRMDRA